MNKIGKFLHKLDKKRRLEVEGVLSKIALGDLYELDIKKLQGRKEVYRVRMGTIRIQFVKTKSGNVVIDISFRDNTTY